MDGLRTRRVRVDHGGLISGLMVRARAAGDGRRGVTLGDTPHVRGGARVEITLAGRYEELTGSGLPPPICGPLTGSTGPWSNVPSPG
ncbi:hypothetical protein ACIBP6_11815 [Nonomuraea terrae]|uniref:hypothetical protein n=1 Tax=Nonomuraea terrae TaxID=2530383 RepID=UPI0037AFE4F6